MRGIECDFKKGASALKINQKELARLQPAEALDLVRGDVEEADLGAEDDVAVGRLNPPARPQPVAVEGGADDAPVGEGDRGGAIPGLHETGVEGVEALELVGDV